MGSKIDLAKLLDAGREVLDALDGDGQTTIPDDGDAEPQVPATVAEGPPSSAPLVGAGAGALAGFLVFGPVGALVGGALGYIAGPRVMP